MLCFNKTQPLNRGWCSATLLLYNYSYNLLKELLLWVMSENMLPCFSSVTHIMVAPVRFSGMHLKLLLPWPGLGFWMGRISSPSSTSSRWMNDWRILAWFWRVYDDHGGDAVGHEPPPPPSPEESPQEEIPKFWGWWGGSPDLSQWTRTKSKMYRTQTFLSVTLLSDVCLNYVSVGRV